MTSIFKVGDRVRVIEDGEYCARAGVCTLLSIHGCKDDVTVGRYEDLTDGEHDESYTQVAHVSDLRLVGVKTKFKDLIHVPTVVPAPSTHAVRKGRPVTRGVLDYFPDAILAVAEVSRLGNEQHNPGEEMHHARGKSTDHADCIVRHLMDRGTMDEEGVRHSAKVAWRALALLQEELEAAGAPMARGAKVAK
jgi:hypothetical protein